MALRLFIEGVLMNFGRKIFWMGLFALACACAPSGFAESTVEISADWKHVQLKSANDVFISVDYQIISGAIGSGLRGPIGEIAQSIWVNLYSSAFKRSDKVRVVLINHTSVDVLGRVIKDPQVFQVPLKYVGDQHFTAQLPDLVSYVSAQRGWAEGANQQELAVLVNDDWLKDPVSGESNFKFQLSADR